MEGTIRIKRSKKVNPRLIVAIVLVLLVVALIVLVIAPRLAGTARPPAPDYWPTTGWRTSAPEAQGMSSGKFADLLLGIREQDIPVHSLLVVRNGYMVVDAAFYPYDGETIHDVASVTKSVMTTLIGIAADQGKLDLDDKMVSFFPDRTIANLDARKEAITVRHLVSMTSGLDCVRDGMEGDSAIAMQRARTMCSMPWTCPWPTSREASSFIAARPSASYRPSCSRQRA